MKAWLDNCQANGGGDTPEAVADALHDVLKLSWRAHATKICVLISDAPPHGLSPNSDSFPKGCPAGFDPLKIVREMAENYITLYTVGVEPSISQLSEYSLKFTEIKSYLFLVPYREFFMSIAYITGGQYVPMVSAKCLAQVIIGGVREEISLESLMLDAQQEIAQEMKQADADGVDEKEKARRVKVVLAKKGKRVRQMRNKKGKISDAALDLYSKCGDMVEMKKNFTSKKPSPTPKAAASIDVDTDYELMEEEEVTVEQAQRIVQKFQNRARAAAGGPVTRQKLKETEDNA